MKRKQGFLTKKKRLPYRENSTGTAIFTLKNLLCYIVVFVAVVMIWLIVPFYFVAVNTPLKNVSSVGSSYKAVFHEVGSVDLVLPLAQSSLTIGVGTEAKVGASFSKVPSESYKVIKVEVQDISNSQRGKEKLQPSIMTDNLIVSKSGRSVVSNRVYERKSSTVVSEIPTLKMTKAVLRSHPLTELNASYLDTAPLEEIMEFLHKKPQCEGKPIFTSMANVGSDLYWQM